MHYTYITHILHVNYTSCHKEMWPLLVLAGGPSAQSLSDLENSVNCVCYQCKEARRKNMEYGEKIHGCHDEVVGVRGADAEDLDGGRGFRKEEEEEELFTGCYSKAVTGVQCAHLCAIRHYQCLLLLVVFILSQSQVKYKVLAEHKTSLIKFERTFWLHLVTFLGSDVTGVMSPL